MKKKHFFLIKKILVFITCFGLCSFSACSDSSIPTPQETSVQSETTDNHAESSLNVNGSLEEKDPPEDFFLSEETIHEEPVPSAKPTDTTGQRDNTPVCLVPSATGEIVYGNELASLDASNTRDGYLCANYTGTCSKVKLQITGPDQVTYTYNLRGNLYETFPLTGGNGLYSIGIYENITGNTYATAFFQEIMVTLENEFSPFLYPSQYVNFTPESETVAKAKQLAASANTDLDVVSNIYNYVISNVTYDYDKASNVASGYICDVDETLRTGTGICLDYASLMASMLRSQGIPTHLEVGYAQDAYHAWISTYVDEIGWINGIIEFDGTNWSLVDPTFAANSSEKSLKKFIGDGSNYTVKYVY